MPATVSPVSEWMQAPGSNYGNATTLIERWADNRICVVKLHWTKPSEAFLVFIFAALTLNSLRFSKVIIMIQGNTSRDRHRVTSEMSKAVSSAGGYLLDFKQFSNLSVCFNIELPPSGFSKLRKKMDKLEVILTPPTEKEIVASEKSEDADIPCSLQVSFFHEEPDLRIPILAVAG